MKTTLLVLAMHLFIFTQINAGGNDPCNCTKNVDMQAAGTAVWVSSSQIRCDGDEGICWKLDFQGELVLTIYVEPPIILRSSLPSDNPATQIEFVKKENGTTIYSYNSSVWTEKK